MAPERVFLAMGCGLGLMVLASLIDRSDIIWNRTESVPKGLYFVARSKDFARGDLVAFLPSAADQDWLVHEGIAGAGWPLLKHVGALPGDEICRCGTSIILNGDQVATAFERRETGTHLPAWQGCQTLMEGEVFLLNDHPRSVDGRYLGVQETRRIMGVARPIWTYGKGSVGNQADFKTIESGSGKASVSRRARLRRCPTGTPKPLSAHLFPCDTGPNGACMDSGPAGPCTP